MTLKQNVPIKSIILAAIIASFVGISVHIFMLREISSHLNNVLNSVSIMKAPYPTYINIFAYLTAILPGLGMAIFYYLIAPHFTTQSKLRRGFALGLLTLLLKGELIRQPVMNILVGNPISVALVQQSQIWLTDIIMAIIIVYMMPRLPKNKSYII